MAMSIVPIEIPAGGGHVHNLCLNLVHHSVQPYSDVRCVDHGPLGDVVGVDYTLRIKEDQGQVFFVLDE
jgi:hypothetical protein